MAFASVGFFLTVDLVDQGGNKGTLRYELTAADFTTAQTDTATILAALANVSEAALVSYRLGEKFVDAAVDYGTGELENIGLYVAKLTTEGKTVNVKVPAPLDSLFIAASGPDYNELDPSNGASQAYLAIWEAASEATISDGEVIKDSATAGNWYGKRIHRGSRKG